MTLQQAIDRLEEIRTLIGPNALVIGNPEVPSQWHLRIGTCVIRTGLLSGKQSYVPTGNTPEGLLPQVAEKLSGT